MTNKFKTILGVTALAVLPLMDANAALLQTDLTALNNASNNFGIYSSAAPINPLHVFEIIDAPSAGNLSMAQLATGYHALYGATATFTSLGNSNAGAGNLFGTWTAPAGTNAVLLKDGDAGSLAAVFGAPVTSGTFSMVWTEHFKDGAHKGEFCNPACTSENALSHVTFMQVSPVPEPETYAMMGIGLLMVSLRHMKRLRRENNEGSLVA